MMAQNNVKLLTPYLARGSQAAVKQVGPEHARCLRHRPRVVLTAPGGYVLGTG